MNYLLTDPWFEAHFFNGARVEASKESFHSRRDDDDTPWTFAESQGVMFYCPCTFGTDAGAHMVMVVFRNPPNGIQPPPDFGPKSRDGKSHPRWDVGGSGIADLTLSPSVDVGDSSCWHGHVKIGIIS